MDSRHYKSSHPTTTKPVSTSLAFSDALRSGLSSHQDFSQQQVQIPTVSLDLTSTPTNMQQPPSSSFPPNQNGASGPRFQQDFNNNSYTPSRQNAIVLDSTQGVTQDQCLRAVADQIGGKNIHYVTRLSGGRICLYLTDSNCVDKAIDGGGIVVQGQFIPARRYVSQAKKVVISNCPPELTDDDLKAILQPFGKIVSPPTRLRVTTVHEDLKHIKSWRRSVYMLINDDPEQPQLPPRMMVTSNIDKNVKHTLYIDKDEILCKFCAGPGHNEDKCKKRLEQERNFPQINNSFNAPVGHRLFVHASNSRNQDTRPPQSTINIGSNDFSPTFLNTQTNLEEPAQVSSHSTSHEKQNEDLLHPESTPSSMLDEEDYSFSTPLDVMSPEGNSSISTFHNFSNQAGQVNTIDQEILKNKRKHSPDETNDPKCLKTYDDEFLTGTDDSSFSEPFNTDSDSEKPVQQVVTEEDTKKPNKKKKKEKIVLDKVISSMNFDNNKLTEIQFREFLAVARGKANSKKVATLQQLDVSELIKQLDKANLLSPDFNLQRRLERASEALKEPDV